MGIVVFSNPGKIKAASRTLTTVTPMPGAKSLVNGVVYDGFEYGINFTYFDQGRNILKTEPYFGRYIAAKNSAYYRFWRFKKQVIDDHGKDLLDALCEAAGGVLYEDWNVFSQKLTDAKMAALPSAFTVDLKETIYTLELDGVAVLGTYHPGVVAVAKNMGGRYLAPMKAWKIANTSALTLKNNLITELHLRDDQVEVIEGVYGIVDDSFAQRKGGEVTIQTFNNAIPDEGAVIAEDDHDNEVYLAVTSPLKSSNLSQAEIGEHLSRYELYDFQEEGVRHLAGNTSALLADDMGLGKTRQAVVAAHILTGGFGGTDKIIIACPASLIINWTREIRMVVPDATIASQGFDANCQWIVTNYERLEQMLHVAHLFKVMVTDEGHLLKEPAAKRTRLAFDIASKVPYRFILTGTPILNRECEIHTLLRLSGHPVGNIPLKKFEEQFAGDATFRAQLNQRIAEWMLRRKKDIVLKTLKGKQHQLAFINPSEALRAKYDAVAKDSSLLALPKIVKLRVLLETIKIDSVMGMIREMNADDKVLVFCEFKDTVFLLKRQLEAIGIGVVTLIGTDTNLKRQKSVDAFQGNPEMRVLIGTTQAAGVGFNLTAANYVIFASLPWTPGLKDQAEDRAYRNGQNRLVIVKIPLMENTIDLDLWAMLKYKKSIATDILNPEEAEMEAQEQFALQMAA